MSDPGEVSIRIETDFSAIAPERWNALSGASKDGAIPYNPFVSHAFLSALEESGSATAKTGWLGQHLLMEDDAGHLLGAVACYLKNHSQGEYVFDQGWADAYERAGGRYYPKLQCCVPFTPATGPRLLHAPEIDTLSARAALAGGLQELARRHKL